MEGKPRKRAKTTKAAKKPAAQAEQATEKATRAKSRRTESRPSAAAPTASPAKGRAARGKRQPTDDGSQRRNTFSNGMLQWFHSRKYQVGLQSPQVDIANEVQWAKRLTTVAKGLVGLTMPFWVSGGADAAGALDALAPFVPLADVLAWRIDGGANAVVPLIYADGISPETLSQRFARFLDLAEPLAELGVRLNLQSMASGNVYPLLVYFDRANFDAAVAALRPQGFQKRFWRRTYLTAGFVDLSAGQVVWAERSGFFALGQAIGATFGVKVDVFNAADLITVLSLAQGHAA